MEKFNYLFSAALAVVAVVACDPAQDGPVDYPVVGDFSLYAESTTGAWAEGDQLGVFVTSDGVMQSNLLYTAAAGEGSQALTAKAEKAGFKQGNHVIYAYAPYAEDVTELASVKMPDYSVQSTYKYDPYADIMPGVMFEYASLAKPFMYTKTEIKEYSSAAVNLNMDSVPLTKVSVMEYGLEGDSADSKVGKKVTKILITAEQPIAIKNATYNFLENKVTSEDSKTIEIKLDDEYKIYKSYFVSCYGFSFYTTATFDQLNGKTVKIEVVLEDGSKYSAEPTVGASYMDPTALSINGLSLTEVK